MDLFFCKLKKLQKQEFNFLKAKQAQKKVSLVFGKLKN